MPPDGRLFLPILPLLLLDSLYTRFLSPLPPTTPLQPFWWFINIAASPLLFSSASPPRTLLALLALYATRFLLEVFASSQAHWLFAVSRSARSARAPIARPRADLVGPHVLSGFEEEAGAEAAAKLVVEDGQRWRELKSRVWPPRRRFFNAILARE